MEGLAVDQGLDGVGVFDGRLDDRFTAYYFYMQSFSCAYRSYGRKVSLPFIVCSDLRAAM